MGRLIGLSRAVNVGGTGKLPMADLKAMCGELGFSDPRTLLASGNVVFDTNLSAVEAKRALEERLAVYAGKPVGVMIRTPDEMAAILSANPFPDAAPDKLHVIFLDDPPPADALEAMRGRTDEAVALGIRELYVHYPSGSGRSKLVIPAAKNGTARNWSTVTKLAAM